MSKVTGLASFTKRGLGAATTAAMASPPAATEESQTGGQPRARAQKSVVAMSFRLKRADWERLHQLAMTEGVSINTLTLKGLSRLFEERGLPGFEI